MSSSSTIASSTKIKFIDPGNALTTFVSIDILIAIVFVLAGLIFFVLGIYYYCKTKHHRREQQLGDQPLGLLARLPHVHAHSKHITIQRSNPNKIKFINTTRESNIIETKPTPAPELEKSPSMDSTQSLNPVARPRPRNRPPPIPTTPVEVDADGILSDGELE